MLLLVIIQVYPTNGGDLRTGNSLLVTELLEKLVYMGQVIYRHVLYKDSHKFVVANAAVEPTEKEDQVEEQG